MRNRCLVLFAVLTLALLAAVAGVGASTAAATQFSGHVTDAVTGAPVPHAVVYAWHAGDGSYYTSWVADAQGAYSLHLSQGAWKLGYTAPFCVSEFWNDKPGKASADVITGDDTVPQISGLDVALARAPQAHIKGRVVDGSTGEPLSDVMVQACTADLWNGANYVYTADDGTYDLPLEPGTWGICYDRWGYERVYHRNASTPEEASVVTVADGDVLTRFDEALPRTAVLVRGLAQDVDGVRHGGFALQLLDPATGAVLRQAFTDVDGECTIDVGDMLGRPLKARMHDPSGELVDADHGTITPELGGNYFVYTWMYAPQRGAIEGRVLDEDGAPVQGVRVDIRPVTPHGSGAESRYSAADGSFRIPGLYVAGASRFYLTFEPGLDHPEYTWQITHQRATDRHADGILVGPGQTVTVDSSLWHVPAIGGDVTGSGNQVLDGIHVDLRDAQGALLASTTTNNGAYHFSKLQLGTYHLTFRDDAGLYAVASRDATPSASEKMWFLDVSLAPLHSIQGRVTAERLEGQDVGGATVTLYSPTGAVVQRQTASDGGYYLFEPLPAGTYIVGVEPALAFLSAFYDDQPWPEAATQVTLDATTAHADVDLTVPVRCASALASVARDDGATDDARPLFARATALAGDGDLVVAGEGWSGSARIFTHEVGGWELQQRLSPGTVSTGDADYGQSVAVSGETVAVGAFYDDGLGKRPGKVFVYTRSGDKWALQQVIAPAGAAYRSFGRSVALSGDTLLVGAPYVTVDGREEAGCAYVYARSGSAWSRSARLTCRGAAGDDHFGATVALQGRTAVIGAPLRDTDVRVNSGQAFVFTGAGAGWSQREVLSPASADEAPGYGESIALDGDTIAVGAPQAGGSGAVCVYTGSAASWARQARLTTSDAQMGWETGRSLALRGDELLVWARREPRSPDGHATGAGYIFRRSGGAWRQDAVLRAPADAGETWQLGSAVAIAGGDELVAAPDEPAPDSSWRGILYAFHPYVTGVGAALTAPSSGGVLANDRAASGKALTATLVRPPYGGDVALAADGSFTYTPAHGWAGTDSFTYTAGDGAWTSLPATVTVTTRDPNAPTVTVEDLPSGWIDHPVTVVLAARDDTEVAAMDYRRQSASQGWLAYARPITVSGQGSSTYSYRARDIFGNARRGSFSVRLDTRRPVVRPLASCSVRRGGMLTVRYRVSDPRPGSPTARVAITALKHGRAVLTLSARCRVGKAIAFRTRCRLPRGKYVLSLTAQDAAGNTVRKPAKTTLRVF
jgi:protocatechuate 3,4-dioxygenase beta subunit